MDKRYNFMIGECFNFAAALHRITNLPLVILYGRRDDDEEICIHAMIVKNQQSIDFEGLKDSPERLLEYYESINEKYDYTEVIECQNESEFWSIVTDCGGSRNEKVISNANDHILKNPQIYGV